MDSDNNPRRIRFLGEGDLHLGVELEVEYSGDFRSGGREFKNVAEVFNGKEKRAVLKDDGSLDNGFEAAVFPATLNYHKNEFNWPEVLDTLNSNDFKAEGSCGLHIHASRKGITDEGLQKLVTFVYSPTNYNLMKHLARRVSSQWARLRGVNVTDGKLNQGGRYYALNLFPTDTVEFRLFAATTSFEELMASLETVVALIEFANTQPMTSMVAAKFVTWVSRRKSTYPHLAAQTLGYRRLHPKKPREVREIPDGRAVETSPSRTGVQSLF
jgi:hypothetical protein